MPRTTSVPLLQNGFRPFFLAATIWAPMALAVWLAALAGFVEPPLALPAPAWHAPPSPSFLRFARPASTRVRRVRWCSRVPARPVDGLARRSVRVVGEAGDGTPRRWLRRATRRALPDGRTGQTPASAASWSSVGACPVAAGGQDLGAQRRPALRTDDPAVGELGYGMLDARGELGDLGDQGLQHGGEGPHQLALGIGLGVSGQALGSRPQAGEQLRSGSPPGVAMLGEEGLQAARAEPGSAVGRRVAADEGEGDRAVDVGEDGAGTRPEAVEQRAQLVGEGEPLRHQSSRPRTIDRDAIDPMPAGTPGPRPGEGARSALISSAPGRSDGSDAHPCAGHRRAGRRRRDRSCRRQPDSAAGRP